MQKLCTKTNPEVPWSDGSILAGPQSFDQHCILIRNLTLITISTLPKHMLHTTLSPVHTHIATYCTGWHKKLHIFFTRNSF